VSCKLKIRHEIYEVIEVRKDKSFLSGKFTSLEKRKRIHANYKKTRDFLNKKGLSVIYLDTDKMNVREVCKRIVNFIKNKINYYLHE